MPGLMKDAWKAAVYAMASQVLGKTFDSKEGLLTVPLRTACPSDQAECAQVMLVIGGGGRCGGGGGGERNCRTLSFHI